MLENENNKGFFRGNLHATRIKEHPAASDGLVNPFLIIFRKFLFLEDKLMTSHGYARKMPKKINSKRLFFRLGKNLVREMEKAADNFSGTLKLGESHSLQGPSLNSPFNILALTSPSHSIKLLITESIPADFLN